MPKELVAKVAIENPPDHTVTETFDFDDALRMVQKWLSLLDGAFVMKASGIRFIDGPCGIVMHSSTCFPVSMARDASWDVTLEQRIGDAIGLEGRAQGANFLAGICINLPRHPAWGCIQETYGEYPILLGEFGLALHRGV
ncbi:uncharacterized protein N7482_002454 [Penicillium canariense]|uniref:beta-glucosidase n=1 Tax=Penicillium canariense TaxID=189055 RepID=A0A9W9IHN9_9EURO|nr:uncharacterized protein N7482_002454 [Penicillium canariense]KAJ5176577.1 hypothetical protein N7482_002454 [Penicillium canariense]